MKNSVSVCFGPTYKTLLAIFGIARVVLEQQKAGFAQHYCRVSPFSLRMHGLQPIALLG